jgi:hypothetical protein
MLALLSPVVECTGYSKNTITIVGVKNYDASLYPERHGRDRMVVLFTITCAISVYYH